MYTLYQEGTIGSPTAAGLGRAKAEEPAAFGAHPAGPTQGGRRLTLAGAVAGITGLNGEPRQKIGATPERPQSSVMRDQERQERNEVVRFRNREAEFFQKSFEVLFGALLTVKALFVMKWFGSPSEDGGDLEVAFGFSHPLPCGPFHRESCPWS